MPVQPARPARPGRHRPSRADAGTASRTVRRGDVPVFVDPTERRPRRAAVVVAGSLAAFVAFLGAVAATAVDADASAWHLQPAARVTTVAPR